MESRPQVIDDLHLLRQLLRRADQLPPGHSYKPCTAENAAENVTKRPDKFDYPSTLDESVRIFVNSMSDLFHSRVSEEFIREVFSFELLIGSVVDTHENLDLSGSHRVIVGGERVPNDNCREMAYEWSWPIPRAV